MSGAVPDEAEKRRVLNRLRRIEGQVRGLQRMVEEERPCEDILTLLAGVRQALDATGEAVLGRYLTQCQGDGQPTQPADVLRVVRLLR